MTLIGRFPQADSIVPQPGNPQALNRYSYTLNNPLRYTDPTGHAFDEGNLGGDVEDWMTVLQRNPSQAFRGWLHERDSAWTVLLYNQQHGAPQEVIEVLQAGLASRQAALDTNGYRGTAQAVSSAFDASAPGVGPGLVGLTAGLSSLGAAALPGKPWGSNRYYYRYASRAERQGIRESIAASEGKTGTVESRSGRTYFSPTRYESARQAQDSLGMPQTPGYRLRVPAQYVDSARVIHTGVVDPVETGLGGGWEIVIEGGIQVPSDVLTIEPLRPQEAFSGHTAR